MVQREIKNKARIYGAVGILSAIVLVAMIYSFGAAPQILSPDSPTLPNASPMLPAETLTSPDTLPMLTFSSYDELNNFVTNSGTRGSSGLVDTSPPMPAPAPESISSTTDASYSVSGPSSQEKDFSTTNIQVEGVDEADSVKTDGTYLYAIVNSSTVYILNAGTDDPQDAQVLSKIVHDDKYLSGIYLSQDGTKLAVLGNNYVYRILPADDSASSLIAPPDRSTTTTFVEVYDVSNTANPVLERNFTMSGNYVNSRMIGDYIYTIITEQVYTILDRSVNLPIIFGEETANIEPISISYIRAPAESYTYTTIVSINIADSTQEPTSTTIMMGYASQMYVSLDNIYVVSPTYTEQTQFSNIYRISINQSDLTLETEGSVPGYPINQYAMDEHNGYFRIATTTWIQDNATTSDGAIFKVNRQLNSIYVLNSDLDVVGKLERFKMDESLQAVRFMDDKCYVVTFKQIDPFFVIDMSDPAAPKIAGELKIPGYSSYLYPIDENHLIGVGKENSTLKLSLFDVTNPNAPTEIAKYIVDASYSDSPALYEPHAFLYDPQRQLLVIPVSVNDAPIILFREGSETATSAGNRWQGVYIFKIDVDNGFTLEGTITQIDASHTQDDDYWRTYNLWINRALYIDDALYTFSNSKIQLNNIETFELISQIDLN